ncbi:phage antirepressor KilAC domain-containing protein [Sutterella wadsworthensis]|uniref:phage antirepressor KilAC domain-containing protein n=1 Tax=Sutterella wadsworthensis TaxID=40545 RepID=UPI003AF0F6BB
MNELIKLSSARINDETVQTCSARDLHRFLGIGKDFSTWVKAQIERAAFAENVDYVKISGKSLSPKRGNSGKTPTEYFFTISASKEISMMSNTPRGKEARLYFIECERVAKEATSFALPDFTNPAIAAREWAKQYELRQALEHKVRQDAPKIDFAEAVTASDAEHTITEASKTLGIRPKKFFDWLRANGFIYKQGTQAMQFSINKGLMVTRFHSFTHSDGEKDQKTHAHVTGKGIFYFYRRLLQEGLIARNPNLELTA